MRLRYLAVAISLVLKYMTIVMLAPICVALYFKDFHSAIAFGVTLLINFVLGFALNPKRIQPDLLNDFKKTEALGTVAFSWIILSFISMIPYLFYGLTPINSLFEAVSGITTTGATILTDFSIYPKTLFFWRSFTQWLDRKSVV